MKANINEDGVYLVNIIDRYQEGRFLPAFINTLEKVFSHVYLISPGVPFENVVSGTFVIAATDRPIDLIDFQTFLYQGENPCASSVPLDEKALQEYLSERNPILLTDDYVPTDILVAQLFR